MHLEVELWLSESTLSWKWEYSEIAWIELLLVQQHLSLSLEIAKQI